MCDEDLSRLLVSAIEETEEELEEQKKAAASFVSACPEDYDETEDEEEYEDNDMYYIEIEEFHMIERAKDYFRYTLNPWFTSDRIILSTDYQALTDVMEKLKGVVFRTKNMTCDYHLR